MGLLRALVLCSIAACYGPAKDGSCILRCDGNGAGSCPSEFACSNGFCAAPRDTCGGDGGVVDVATLDDAGGDGASEYCIGTGVRVCFPSIPTGSPIVTSLNTDSCSGTYTSPTLGFEICVIAGDTITVNGSHTFTGSRPLVFVGVQSIVLELSSLIDVSSRGATGLGAGGNPGTAICGAPNVVSTEEGGMGGSLGGIGGTGGNGAVSPVNAAPGFHGGCPGSSGGGLGAGGHGGGAVYFISNGTITIAGGVLAAGGGGRGGTAGGGGGGGGSGGFVGFDAPAINLNNAQVVASGGGGGQGGGSVQSGESGQEATLTDVTAPGGTSNGTGGAGGAGGVGGNGAPGNVNITGGGGGGGTGIIRRFNDTSVVCNSCSPALSGP